LVTQADVEVELLLARGIAERFPDDAFLGEETGASRLAGAHGVWVVDPIDGTQPFVSGMASWCVSIAYVQDGVLQFGFVHNPPLGELFEGGLGRPASLNGRPSHPIPAER
jgi:myo-inositol-1(or 4)-monophosphatase